MLSRIVIAATAAIVSAVVGAPIATAGLQTYGASAELEPSVASLHWTLNDSAVLLGLVITDAAVVTANATALWIGLGIGEPTSGGMLGADIVTGEFDASGQTCRLVDRHVPSVAYPLGSTAGGGRGAYPVPDDCGTKSTWALIGCAVEPATGTLTLEVSRDLAAGDPAQDRSIVAGRNIFLYAYGDGFSHHGARRKSVAVDLTETGPAATGDAGLAESGRLPSDVVTSQMLTMPNYVIPTNRTEYACASFTIDLPPAGAGGAGRRQVVAAEAVVDKTTVAGQMVHHFLIFSCAKEGIWDKFATEGAGSCFDEQPNCRDIVWAAGADPLVMPPDAGFPVTDEERFYVMQTHYDNPTGVAGVVDNSSVRLHFSDTPRQYDAGTISIGDSLISLAGQSVEGGRNYTFSCPSECTSQMVQPSITIFASMLHAHLTGLRLWTNLYRNGSFVRTIEESAFWSNEHQRNTLLQANTTLQPGDELRMSCEYDVDKVTALDGAPPVFGLGTTDEMCMSFLFVYPRPTLAIAGGGGAGEATRLAYCSPWEDGNGTVSTFCGGINELRDPNSGSRLAIDSSGRVDTGGFTSVFGGAPTCTAATT